MRVFRGASGEFHLQEAFVLKSSRYHLEKFFVITLANLFEFSASAAFIQMQSDL